MKIVEADVRMALQAMGTENSRAVEQDAELTGLLVDVLNGSLAALEGKLPAALGFLDKCSSIASFGGKVVDNKAIGAASTSAQLLLQSASLFKLTASASPGMVSATVGAMFAKKVSLAFGLVEESRQAKIVGVTADMVSSVLTFGLAATSLTGPVGWILLVGALAQVGASAHKAYALKEAGKKNI